ncbi:MAG: bifunctional demethylmenaquinone methyltransferase/2-methoxy-6-polyprenyl-1,4-benzoquinol methylase UbiE [Marinilabiliaceae bacterium]|nr:bifunctional demethylmenaquinone methyltransferase/2-methoxy-6-polyprenyl-1,4-benzoquinol methylase UbiE [Marinilabiliaceae bacterium]
MTPKSKMDKNPSKIAEMFNSIAFCYRFVSRSMSFGLDKKWRKRAVKLLKDIKNPVILDVATGTGDLAIELTKLNPISVYAIDISTKMLEKATQKNIKKRLQMTIFPKVASAENLPFENNSFHAVTVAFGVRNFDNLEKGLQEIYRVMKPKGRVIILEISVPTKKLVKQLYHFYLTKIIPWWGGMISGKRSAYKYLSKSVLNFPNSEEFEKILTQIGFKVVETIKMTFGVVTIYCGEK